MKMRPSRWPFLPVIQDATVASGVSAFVQAGTWPFVPDFHPNIKAVVAFHPTEIHNRSLGAGKCDDTLERLATSRAAHLFVWGRQDPHVPLEDCQRITSG